MIFQIMWPHAKKCKNLHYIRLHIESHWQSVILFCFSSQISHLSWCWQPRWRAKKILPIILIFTMVQKMTTTTTTTTTTNYTKIILIILMMLVMVMAHTKVKMILMMMMTNVDLRLVQPWLGHPFSICLVATSPPHRSNGQWSSFSSTFSWELFVQFCTNFSIQMT